MCETSGTIQTEGGSAAEISDQIKAQAANLSSAVGTSITGGTVPAITAADERMTDFVNFAHRAGASAERDAGKVLQVNAHITECDANLME